MKILAALISVTMVAGLVSACAPATAPISGGAQQKADPFGMALETASGRFSGVMHVSTADGESEWFSYGQSLGGVEHGPPVTYPIASVTKVFTAVAILRLVEQGRLKLDDRLSSRLSELEDHAAGNVTVRQLLSHSSGVPSVMQGGEGLDESLDPAAWPEPTSIDQELEPAIKLPLHFEPGTNYSYSNSGYLLLGKLIERVTGEPYQEAVLQLSGLQQSSSLDACFCDTLREGSDAIGVEWGTPQTASPAIRVHPSRSATAGGLRISAEQLAAWAHRLIEGKILQHDTLDIMWRGEHPTRTPGEKVGLGWFVRESETGKIVMHEGTLPGITTTLAIAPKQGRVALGILNPSLPMAALSRSEDYIRQRTLSLLSGDRPAGIPLLGENSLDLDGRYSTASGERVVVRRLSPQSVSIQTSLKRAPLLLPYMDRIDSAEAGQAAALIKAWSDEGENAIRSRMSEKLASAIPAGALGGQWQDWLSRFGEFVDAHVFEQGGKDNRNQRLWLQFDHGAALIGTVFDTDGTLMGLQLLGEPPDALPAEEKAWVTADAALWIDGYFHDLDPVLLTPRLEATQATGLWIGPVTNGQPQLQRQSKKPE